MYSRQVITPDWIIIGVSWQDGVAVFASKTLDHITLTAIAEEYTRFELLQPAKPISGYTFDGKMSSFVFVHGATYAEALARLSAAWEPDEPRRPALCHRTE